MNLSNLHLSIYKNKLNSYESIVISRGNFSRLKSIPTRVLSKQIKKKDLYTNKEIKKNMKLLSKYKNFLLVIVNNEIYKDKSETNLTLRYYGIGAQIIKDFNVKNMILISRTKKKIIGLEGFGLKITKQLLIK